jgi:hypothetical protein
MGILRLYGVLDERRFRHLDPRQAIRSVMTDEVKLLSFRELGLRFGQGMDLLPNPGDKDLVFPCELVGCLQEECLLIGPIGSDGVMPRMVEGQRVVMRVKLAGGIALFPTTVLFVSEIPVIMIYLDYPRDIKFKPVRGAFRVDVTLPVLAANLTDKRISGVAGKIVDISVSGARLEMFEELGGPGHDIEIKGKFQVGNIQRTLQISAVIRTRAAGEGRFVYGVEFRHEDEDKQVVLLGFTFHAMVFGHIQNIR